MALNDQSGAKAGIWWSITVNWPCVIKALWQVGLVGSPVLIFKGPIGAIKFPVNCEELDFNSGFRGHWVSRSLLLHSLISGCVCPFTTVRTLRGVTAITQTNVIESGPFPLMYILGKHCGSVLSIAKTTKIKLFVTPGVTCILRWISFSLKNFETIPSLGILPILIRKELVDNLAFTKLSGLKIHWANYSYLWARWHLKNCQDWKFIPQTIKRKNNLHTLSEINGPLWSQNTSHVKKNSIKCENIFHLRV